MLAHAYTDVQIRPAGIDIAMKPIQKRIPRYLLALSVKL
jgi:hypothetical protein